MKLQHLSIIFVIIIIPIALVMSQYLQAQIDTITLQSKYQVALDAANYAALTAFQVNSINNKYSSISDSKIRDVEASINSFYNSLGTSMNRYVSSKELRSFTPAILFNLYDGYYIYSSYANAYGKVPAGDDKEKVIIDETKRDFQYGLHPYIYYSCKYKLNNGNIIVINYTLDNEITVYGDLGNGEGYQKKSGYLINLNDIENIDVAHKTLTYCKVDIGPETLTENLLFKDEFGSSISNNYNYIIYRNQKVYEEPDVPDTELEKKYFWYNDGEKKYLQGQAMALHNYIIENGVGFKSTSAFDYYYEAYQFTNWLLNETDLDKIKQGDAIKMEDGTETVGDDTGYFSANTGNERIFKVSTDNDPMESGSAFNTHRMAVIRKSIETNLLTAITTYQNSLTTYQFVLPVIDEENWYSICNNVSIISFMQGIPIGMRYFNGYSVLSNTKNEEVINQQTIYIVTKEASSDALEYHRPGCKSLIEGVVNGNLTITGAYTSLSFLRQTVKFSEVDIEYFYPQSRKDGMNPEALITGCYDCIVGTGEAYDVDDIIKGEIKDYTTGTTLYDKNKLKEVRKKYLTALARERNDLYKSSVD